MTISEILNDGAVAIEKEDALVASELGLLVMDWSKESPQVEEWPEIADVEWQRVNQKTRKLLVAGYLALLSAHSGPETARTE